MTSEAFARLNPAEKIVEAKFRISLHVIEGDEKELAEFVVEIQSPAEHMQVEGFLPGTKLESDFVGEIEVSKTQFNKLKRNARVGGRSGNQAIISPGSSKGKFKIVKVVDKRKK